MTSITSNSSENLRSNFEAAAIVESHIQLALAPYLGDSVIKVNLLNNDYEWFADVMIDSTRGLKATRRKNSNLQMLIQTLIEDLENQFKQLESNLRTEIFSFDLQQEYDYYTETLQSSTPKAMQKLKVLVIEDDPTASLILEKSLQCMGCQVELMNNPRKAIDKLLQSNYDLVILDWCLPYMNGSEFLKKADAKLNLKNSGDINNKAIPLIICSSKNSNEINLPLVSNFLFCQYWDKQLPFTTVISSIETSINSVRKHKTKAA